LLFCAKIACCQSYHHNLFGFRLAFADTINKKTKVEFYLQKRTQGTVGHQNNIFKSNQFNSVWFWLTLNVSKTSKISFSPFGYFENYALNAKPLDENLPPTK
jgi:hypothetical protein